MPQITNSLTAQERINDKLKRYFNITMAEANTEQLYNACEAVVRDEILTKRNAFSHSRHEKKG